MFAIYETSSGKVLFWKDSTKFTYAQLAAALPSEWGVVETAERLDVPAVVVEGEVVAAAVNQNAALDREKLRALFELNNSIASVRLQFATDGPFQSVAYELKREEARAYLNQEPGTYTLLSNISVIRGMTQEALANLWLTTNDEWLPLLKQTETIRDIASFSIKQATSEVELDLAIATYQTALASLTGN